MDPLPIRDASVEILTTSEIFNVLTLSAGLNSALVLIGTTLLGIAGGIIGNFIVLRKRALISDALAHCTLPGLCLAFIFSVSIGISNLYLPILLLGAAITGIIGVLCINSISRFTRLREDAAIGAVLSVFFGAGIVLLSVVQSLGAGGGGLTHFIYGQTAALNSNDITLLLIVAILVLALTIIFIKEFSMLCFDSEFAAVQGWPVHLLDVMMLALATAVTIVGLQSVGLILVVAALIIPPAAARFWTDSLSVMLILSSLIGGLGGYIGSAASALLPRMPAGSVIVLTLGFFFFISFFFAPNRGVFANILRHYFLRIKLVSALKNKSLQF